MGTVAVMMLSEQHVSLILRTAILLSLSSLAGAGEEPSCVKCGVVISWAPTGKFTLEKGGDFRNAWFQQNELEVNCELFEDKVARAVTFKAHNRMNPALTIRLYDLERLTVKGISNKVELDENNKPKPDDCEKTTLTQKVKLEKVNVLQSDEKGFKETYEMLYDLKDNCYKRTYTISQSSSSELEVLVVRDKPELVKLEDCTSKLLSSTTADAKPGVFYEKLSPSGTYYQQSFDADERFIIPISKKVEVDCKKTVLPGLKLDFVANLRYNALVIDRFKVATCKPAYILSSIQIKEEKDDQPKVTIWSNDAKCYGRTYKIEKINSGEFEVPYYSLEKSDPTLTTCLPEYTPAPKHPYQETYTRYQLLDKKCCALEVSYKDVE